MRVHKCKTNINMKGNGNMKERYETPEMEIVEFETEDIITTSGAPETPFVPFS